MPRSHVLPPYRRQEEAISFAKGVWLRSLSTPVKVCFRCSRNLGLALKKKIKIAKLLIVNAGYLQKNKASFLKVGDFCRTVLGLSTSSSRKAVVGAGPGSHVEVTTPTCFPRSAIAGAISSGLAGLCWVLLQPLKEAKLFCEHSTQDLAKAKLSPNCRPLLAAVPEELQQQT